MASDSTAADAHIAQPGTPPKDLCVGCINPRALTETILGRKVKWDEVDAKQIISDTLQTQYDELFDLKYGSPLYAGLKLRSDRTAARAAPSDIKLLGPADLATPNLAAVKNLSDLGKVGVSELGSVAVSQASLVHGKLNLELVVPELDKTPSNLRILKHVSPLVLGANVTKPGSAPGEWNPANATWKDVGDFERDVTEMDDPIQGAVGDCWLIAALSAVAWSLPYSIVHRTRSTGLTDNDHVSQLTFFSKGGGRDAPTGAVEVTDAVLVNSANGIIYGRSRDAGELWPALYEKGFAKWATKNGTDRPDISTLNGGDCVLSIAQLTDRKPVYYYTSQNTPDQLWGLVRSNSAGGKTLNPMTAWTYASGDIYNGSNIVAWHCYTILGWAYFGNKQYIVLRNPWGFNEPAGSNTYQGVVTFLDAGFWRPISTTANDGIFALEASAFKVYFAGLGVAVV